MPGASFRKARGRNLARRSLTLRSRFTCGRPISRVSVRLGSGRGDILPLRDSHTRILSGSTCESARSTVSVRRNSSAIPGVGGWISCLRCWGSCLQSLMSLPCTLLALSGREPAYFWRGRPVRENPHSQWPWRNEGLRCYQMTGRTFRRDRKSKRGAYRFT